MKIDYRTQNDEALDDQYYGDITGIDCTNDPGFTRQEQKIETDVNYILSRYGVPEARMAFATVDYNMDLQKALEATHYAKVAYSVLPADLKKDFPDWMALLHAIDIGAVKINLGDKPSEAGGTPPPVPPA